MRHITTILLLLTLALPVAAQQWESYSAPAEISFVRKLCNLQNNVFLNYVDGIYRSQDGGDHWQRIYNHTPPDVYGPLLLEADRKNNRLYYAEIQDTIGYKLFRSNNMGDSWSYLGSIEGQTVTFIADTLYAFQIYQNGNYICKKLNSAPWQPIYTFPYDTAGYIRNILGQDQHLWVLAGKGLYHSPDAGYHWELSRPLSNLPPLLTIGQRVYVNAVNEDLFVLNEYEVAANIFQRTNSPI